ncbi:hypothetical protein MN116_000002 [Schistosoma mekongi]|uniref:Uncharacterized protein n=1 Tax=Schistosoma mekongi TaxID=38744 RepID=A0AAE1ZCQ3_SCHME|nr:hypothetical protein MN116_000002 [Schistosoma mekongi]
MEVFTEKRDENLNEPPVIPVKAAPASTPRQPPLLETSSDYSVWKFRVTAYLRKVPTSDHFDYLLSYLDDECVKRAAANGFAASNSPAENWKILDNCFSLPTDTQQLTIQFLSRHQDHSENPIDYLHSLQQLAVRAFPHLDVVGREELVRSRFVEGLMPGPLREHLLRMPPVDTVDLKRTTLRFLTAERLFGSAETPRPIVMTVEPATEAKRFDNIRGAAAIRHRPGPDATRKQSTSMSNRRPSWNNYQGRQTACPYCRRFGRNARRCGHNRPHNSGRSRINVLEEEERALCKMNLHDDV